MKVARENHGGAVLLAPEGQVDMESSPELHRHLKRALDARATPLVVDLSGVPFIDSSGLATLVDALKGVSRYGGQLRLVGLAPAVQNLFQIANLTSIFDIRSSRDDALRVGGG